MDILIIGNGFDLAHHLPTRYTDFLEYCHNYNESDPVSQSDEMNKEFASIIRDNIWLKYFINSKSTMENLHTWIDFEKEIGEIINLFESINPSVEETRYFSAPREITLSIQSRSNVPEKFISFISLFCNFSRSIQYSPITVQSITDTKSLINTLSIQLRFFARAFEIYCLKLLEFEISSIDYLSMSSFNCVLSFNYTNTYERLYGKENTKYCYIHGKAQSDAAKTNIIFGIDDELSSGEENRHFKYARFKKYYQRILFKTGSEYKDWLTPPKNQGTAQDYVHIVGHSLDKTDHDILYEIFDKKHLKIIVYFYNADDFEDKVQKVIRLLACKDGNGRDELIRRVHGSQWSIKFVDQYDEVEGLFMRPENGGSVT